MKGVAPHDRPREKLERLGPAGLGDNELLAVVLGGGVRGHSALDLANRLMEHAGGLNGFTRLSLNALCHIAGIGHARAAQVIAAIELGRRTLVRDMVERPRLVTPRQVAGYLLPEYGSCAVEQCGILMLDSKNRVLRIKLLSVGSLDSTVVHPREVFREAAAAAAAAIILFHNHPSGDPSPSRDDFALTLRMVSAGEIMGIDVIDHLILADQTYYSMMEAGHIPRRAAERWSG